MFRIKQLYGIFLQRRELSRVVIKLGNVTSTIDKPSSRELVPVKYLPKNADQVLLSHLQWMMQKDNLNQDIFLLGYPGSYRRRLAMAFCELTQREVEYVSLSRDTTETDLKQRREIINGNAEYVEQSALKAALNGRILILDGVEKTERNVLPILNNLLENREMQLEDGRFLMRSIDYDRLQSIYSSMELDKWRLLRCSERFRVIALGLPVPLCAGQPLDPPLRSRFQGRFVIGGDEIGMNDNGNEVGRGSVSMGDGGGERREKAVMAMLALRAGDGRHGEAPLFPMDNAGAALAVMARPDSGTTERQAIHSVWPYTALCDHRSLSNVEQTMRHFKIDPRPRPHEVSLPPTTILDRLPSAFVRTATGDSVLSELWHSLGVPGDVCVVGPPGSGRTATVEALAALKGAKTTPVVLYADMTSREVLQRRDTSPEGDTVWRHSELVRAALEGRWAVLHGLHRLERGCVAVLAQLASDRQLQLFDGRRLLRDDRYEAVKVEMGLDDAQMTARGILKVHPEFRMVAIADPPSVPGQPHSHTQGGLSSTNWLSAEVLAMFRFHILPPLTTEDQLEIVTRLVPDVPPRGLTQLLDVAHQLRHSTDSQLRELSHSLSLRQVLRIARRLARYPEDENIPASVHKACLSKFLPRHIRASLDDLLQPFHPPPRSKDASSPLSDSEQLELLVAEYHRTNSPSKALSGEETSKVPKVLFYDSVAHTRILLDMMRDFTLTDSGGPQHLLLVGNQGVGKNKIADRLLELLSLPREYLQLHRDSSVQSLTVQPAVRDGRLVYEDSPLVKAAIQGRILVLDEADKASTEVTCVLRALLSPGGEMALGDGRRLVVGGQEETEEGVVRVSPRFRAIVLANRPGFPFLGNDFFGAIGDIFSCHAVDNPDSTSEVAMLQRYGPSVPLETIQRLVALFSDLRSLADQGHTQYPYSTRELVNVVRHLQKYPNDALSSVLGNVFDFDRSSKEMMSIVEDTLEKHGISLPGTVVKVVLARELALPTVERSSSWILRGSPRTLDQTTVQGHIQVLDQSLPSAQTLETVATRSRAFSELSELLSLRLGEYNIVSDLVASSHVHFATLNPLELYTLALPSGDECRLSSCKVATRINVGGLFPDVQGAFRPRVHLAICGNRSQQVLFHEASTNVLLQIDTVTGDIVRLACDECLSESKVKVRTRWYGTSTDTMNANHRDLINMHRNWSTDLTEPFVVFHKAGEASLSILNIKDNGWSKVNVGIPMKTIHLVSRDIWLAQDTHNLYHLISRSGPPESKFTLQRIYTENKTLPIERLFNDTFAAGVLGLDSSISATSHMTLGISSTSYTDFIPISSLSDKTSSILSTIPRPTPLLDSTVALHSCSTALPASGIIVSSVKKGSVPKQCLNGSQAIAATSTPGYLEVVNLRSRTIKYLPVPSSFAEPVTFKWLSHGIPTVFLARLGPDIIGLDNTGCFHQWTLCPERLHSELSVWKRNIGVGGEPNRDLMIERQVDDEIVDSLGKPKHGKVDPSGAPHVGGNTWAGGSGGRDTAGMGGIGGPYRLDGGHDVYQVPDSVRSAVPESVKRAAREIAQRAWKQRLQEIEMSEVDYELYQRYYRRVEAQVAAIRVLVDSLQATAKERQWIRHRTHGDLDDGKLVEGVLGERTIYRARGEKEPEPGAPQMKPKRLRVVADVSGSMYRFNGQDQRMERQIEALLMLMESFSGVHKEKMVYDICGHSGEGPQFPFVNLNEPPKNEKQRMDVLMAVLAHSQFCVSGDHTLEAIEAGMRELARTEDDMDQSFLVVLSDANLARYGIDPAAVARLLQGGQGGGSGVQAYVVFIGGQWGGQAEALRRALPVGRSFLCMDSEALPAVLRDIFTATVLR